MSLLKTIGPGEASPEIEKIYQSFIDAVGAVPPPFLMYSTSPGIQALQAELINYYREGSNLSPMLTGLIRYLTAVALDMESCIEFNARALKAHGISDEEIEGLKVNPAAAPLDERKVGCWLS